jgi:hypothetical protein
MQLSSLIPQSIVKQKKLWVPKIDTRKIVKFIKQAYYLDEDDVKPTEKGKE